MEKNTNGIPLRNPGRTYETVTLDKHQVKLLNIIGTNSSCEDRIINDREQLKWVVEVFKKEGKKIVYTSGVYDMLHEGHVRYLERAKSYGDILIVGVDSDDLVRKLKPDLPNRPTVKLAERLLMLAYVRPVNILTVRTLDEHEDQLIVDILPDVAVFSRSTNNIQNFEEKIRTNLEPYCGEIIFLDPQAATSTTARIRLLMAEGAIGKDTIEGGNS